MEHCVSLVECKHVLNGKDKQVPREEEGTFWPEHATYRERQRAGRVLCFKRKAIGRSGKFLIN